jgi:SAM-dependent methyltransferase
MTRLVQASDGTHAAVLELVGARPAAGRLLDAPCGSGVVGAAAAALGFEVSGVDLELHPELRLPRAALTLGDLDRGLPFPDAHFAVAVSVEGIEHLERPRAFVRELARVLAPGGRLILSTPNVLSVTSRWRWLTRGYHRFFTPDARGVASSGHLHAMDYVLLRRCLEDAGLALSSVRANRLRRGLKERLLALCVRLGTRRARHPFEAALLEEALLFGEVLVIEAEKVG